VPSARCPLRLVYLMDVVARVFVSTFFLFCFLIFLSLLSFLVNRRGGACTCVRHLATLAAPHTLDVPCGRACTAVALR